MNRVPSKASPLSGLGLLVEWANEQDQWIRRLASEVIKARRRSPDESIDAIYETLLREKELKEGNLVKVEPISAGDLSAPSGMTLRLVSLRHIENVNALLPNQEIEFHPRLTICFGENASGKTGYVRILKRAAAVRTAEPVLPNIHGGGAKGTPQAILKVLVGDEERSIEWQGEEGLEPLTRIDIFDARAAVVHLAEDLTYSYTPADLALYPLVTEGIERVQEKLQAAKEKRRPRQNPFINRFQRESRIYPKIEGLGASTDLQNLEKLAQVSEEEEAALPDLRQKVEALRSGVIKAQISQAERNCNILTRAFEVANVVAAFDSEAYRQAVAALQTAQAKHEQATRTALESENIPGILGKSWKEFIEAAERYIRESGIDPYPISGEPCVYCRQPLTDAAVSLITKYRDYCNAALRQEVEQASKQLRMLCEPIENLRLDELANDLDTLVKAIEDPSKLPIHLEIALKVMKYARALQQAIAEGRDCPAMSEHVRRASAVLCKAVESVETTVNNMREQLAERDKALASEQARLRDLEDRLTLRGLLPAIRDHVNAARWADRAGIYLGRFQGIKRSLTETAKRASSEVLNRDFERSFRKECQALRAPEVTLDFPGRGGEPRRRKLLTAEHGLNEILSEGEQKVIALADFFAEASLKPDRSPIVLDDPVTSLDHKRLRYVVDRIFELSKDRQVVVFTHDIWFAAELLARFEREPKDCAFYDVTAEGQQIGLVTRGSHPRTDTFNDRKRRITRWIEQAEKETGETRQALIEKGYEELRGACEVVVEKDLLKGVTERFRPNVRMTVLDQIRSDRLPNAIRKIVPIFERCCRVIASHSQPLTSLGTRPTFDELKEDWKTLQDARREYVQQ